MKKRAVVFLIVLCIVVGIAIAVFPKKKANSHDYPVGANLKEISVAADYIVEGKFTEYLGSWNMARDLSDSSKESKDEYVEGKRFNFEVSIVYKGDLTRQNIVVNQTYQNDFNGKLEIDENYVEVDLDHNYIVFLYYDPQFDSYYGCIEPWLFKVDDGKIYMQSHLTEIFDNYEDVFSEMSYAEFTGQLD